MDHHSQKIALNHPPSYDEWLCYMNHIENKTHTAEEMCAELDFFLDKRGVVYEAEEEEEDEEAAKMLDQ